MRSEDRAQQVREALAGPADAFRSALARTVEELRGILPTANGKGQRDDDERVELGVYAQGRIDTARFATLVSNHRAAEPVSKPALDRAHATLSELLSKRDETGRVEVPSGGSLRDTVAAALADVGRAFGAARVADLARTGRYEPARHDAWMEGFPFARWNRAERRLAPPLLVGVDGADLLVDGLGEFMDGTVRIVLLVRGPAPPAALVRLVSPGTLVLQTADESGLERLARHAGPGVAAVVPDGAARFLHDPDGGPHAWDRITIEHLPSELPRRALGGLSAAQQADQLAQLAALAASPQPAAGAPAASGGSGAPAPPSDPVDKLAAWLLSNADLKDLP